MAHLTVYSTYPVHHRTARWAHKSELQRSEPNGQVTWLAHRTVSGGAPDCPVRHPTEGKNCLPGLLPTAPSCLGAIKGTPRRMEEYTKYTYNIPKHQDIDLAHSFHCDSI